jgi:hypothetical protein
MIDEVGEDLGSGTDARLCELSSQGGNSAIFIFRSSELFVRQTEKERVASNASRPKNIPQASLFSRRFSYTCQCLSICSIHRFSAGMGRGVATCSMLTRGDMMRSFGHACWRRCSPNEAVQEAGRCNTPAHEREARPQLTPEAARHAV